MGPVIFDTNILIDNLRGIAEATAELSGQPLRSISVISWMEIMAGATPSTEARLREFLAEFTVIEIDDRVMERAVVIRREQRLKLPDAIILATAQVNGLTLVTRNTKDFRPDGPGIRVPYTI